MQIVPPQILSYSYKNERSVAFKIRQNPFFSAGALPRTPLRELSAHPDPLVGWKGDTPSDTHPSRQRPTFSVRHASPSIPARFTPIGGADMDIDHGGTIPPEFAVRGH